MHIASINKLSCIFIQCILFVKYSFSCEDWR
uniref:Uncharacterized protein n=2 Tax=unclassified Caudoviricetes TaxID=2788787 RepID=A0A8S5SSQ4_9CAUD|nr:MAG TPA: hypothetical protein [Siphoviridae sp. ctrMZ4]DAF14027.1 MAG TPA: hypothetical protein [Caudoviricetes sp.]DAF53976.1 MAG TPA: hypothetical protein [Siphoviridae sp. cttuC6]DAM69282.1 MAG TPA: hypothetical protein [Caudoviricetes sp.]DAP48718.1 MAG TPA: hypothetical protein [Caudoviricetes sp.]